MQLIPVEKHIKQTGSIFIVVISSFFPNINIAGNIIKTCISCNFSYYFFFITTISIMVINTPIIPIILNEAFNESASPINPHTGNNNIIINE